jgi:hypothetical protein
MYLKCAHPDCSSDFDYTQGRLFRFRQSPRHEKQPTNWHGVKHFWLCARCCKSFTIEYQHGMGILLLQRLEAISGGQPCYCVLQADDAPKTASPVGRGHSTARRRQIKAELDPVALSTIEILETRNV